ncbi:MAG: hypothetical protein AAF320_06710 [Myxococcota bacterium]
MKHNKDTHVPLWFHPTAVVCVDDDANCLRDTAKAIKGQCSYVMLYKDPKKALQFLNNAYQPDPCVHHLVGRPDENELQQDVIPQLHHALYASARFEQVAVAVVDHHMPDMNGLEFCEKLRHKGIYTVLLTNVLNEKHAVQAFHDGSIHGYVHKGDPQAYKQLQGLIGQAQQEYFWQLSQFLRRDNSSYYEEYQLLNEPAFCHLFAQVQRQLGVQEHYLFEAPGSFLLLDKQGNDHALFTADHEQAAVYLQSAESEGIPQHIEQGLAQRELMLCYHNARNPTLPAGNTCAPYVHPAKQLPCQQKTYTYHLGQKMVDLQRERMVLLQDFQARRGKIIKCFE